MLSAISLFTGVGGLDFGFERAGFDTAVAVEMDPVACATLRANRDWPVIEGDINEVSSEDILKAAGLAPGEADVLIGGPPCQPFSKAGYWSRGDALRLDDPRANTLTAYLRVLRDARPRAFLMENVVGLAFKGKDEGLQHVLQGVEQINRETGTRYRVTWAKLNAAHFGVPQFRERVFLVGLRDGDEFEMPEPTHGDGLLPYHTAWDAMGDLPKAPNDPDLAMSGKWADLLPSIPEGENYLWHTDRGGGMPLFGWRTRYWSFLLKLAKDRPSWTIQAQPGPAIGPFHWANRRLSPQEMCRLQTFPDGLTFDCGIRGVQKLLGNAVPSLLAETLALRIRHHLTGEEERPSLMPPRREPVPSPEKVWPVAERYRDLAGEHEAHPGTGLGRGAARRSA